MVRTRPTQQTSCAVSSSVSSARKSADESEAGKGGCLSGRLHTAGTVVRAQAGGEVALRFQETVDSRLRLLCEQPGLGRLRRFKHPKLQNLRSFVLGRPF